MAITAAALQAQLGTNVRSPKVIQEVAPYGAVSQFWLIDGGTTYPGRVKFVKTTASDNAATQAATVATAMLAGPA